MTDRELAVFGERLYQAVLLTPLPAGTILGLATAIRHNVGWSELPKALRFSVFKIAAVCLAETSESSEETTTGSQDARPTPEQAPTAADGRPEESEPKGGAPAGADEPSGERTAAAPEEAESGGSAP
jgi:hypothetical protein